MNASEFIQSCMRFIYCVLLICAILTGFTMIGNVEVTAKHIFFLLAVALLTMIGNRLFVNDRHYMSLLVWMGITGCSLFIITWFTDTYLQYYEINTFIGFWCSICNFMIFLIALIPNGFMGRLVKAFLFLIIFLPIAILWGYYFATGMWFGDTAMLVHIMNMNPSEILLAIGSSPSWKSETIVALLWVGISMIFSKGERLIFERMSIGTISGCVLFLLLNGALLYRTHENMVMNHIYSAYEIINHL